MYDDHKFINSKTINNNVLLFNAHMQVQPESIIIYISTSYILNACFAYVYMINSNSQVKQNSDWLHLSLLDFLESVFTLSHNFPVKESTPVGEKTQHFHPI